MTKKDFSAVNWFAQNKIDVKDSTNNIIRSRTRSTKAYQGILAPFIDQKQNEIVLESELNKFFVPGWKGESLISKDIKSFIQIIDQIHQDVKEHFVLTDKFSRSLKRTIFDEFLNFAEFKSLNCIGLDTQINFWKEINNSESPHRDEIDHFLNIFSFRIAVIYLLKVRFITTLFNKTNTKLDIKNIYYPNSFFTSVFQSSSSTELKTKSFKQNVYSWYKPNKSLENELKLFKDVCINLKITEIIKTISVKSEAILEQQTEYSHSISHKQFG